MVIREMAGPDGEPGQGVAADVAFRAAFDHASVGMAVASNSGHFIKVNPALGNMLGHPAESLAGVHFSEITHPDDVATGMETMRSLASGHLDAARWEKRYVHRDGHTVWAELRIAPVRGDAGGVEFFVAEMEDVTARRESEAAHEASEDRFRRAFETAAAGVALVSVSDGRLLRVNPAGCAMLGYTERELQALTIQDVTAPEDREESMARFRRVVTGEVPTSRARLRYLRKDGSTAHSIVSTALMRDLDGRPLHLVANVVDISEQVEAQEELSAMLASKDEFIASVSHELRTPLSAVVGFAQLLRNEMSSFSREEQMEMLERISEQSADLSNIVEDLLVAARADGGTLSVARVCIDLRAQAEQVLESMGSGSSRVSISGGRTESVADPVRVRQIVRNLVSNALRWGGDEVRISVERRESTAHMVVADNGPGIPPEERERIFEPFHRAGENRELAASVGLGLAVSSQLAVLMGGELGYDYESGMSVFELTLPGSDRDHR